MSDSADLARALTASKLDFGFPGHDLFKGLSAVLVPGVNLVRGGDGRGKTSLLQLLAGQLPASSGTLELNGARLDLDAGQYRRQVFYIEPRTEAYDEVTPPEVFAQLQARHPSFDQSLIAPLCEGLSLTPHLEKKLFMLSTGSKRKVYLAAALAAGAPLTLLDDPFAGLDQASINFVSNALDAQAVQARQVWVLAMAQTPTGIRLATTVDLGD
ncbi:ATP-binding cassette domain-containing protein [Herbaspirillum sp. YR522]|uniref:ABC transporter ATP-binding protein n=1 Tax=Herbaspirillum sp. YR522 TaxID=1144342 RepID=UPI00026FCD60|nr:ATP-binding cassette domain-containing protein [Herbaspirillum sp. YR522]EJN05494.1 ABC-type multidrug transport system, ATPase component [Herbaspirillum sp. YR522]